MSRFSLTSALEEMHILAYIYHWEPSTLWKLKSRERRMWVRLILAQKKMENESMKINSAKMKKPKSR